MVISYLPARFSIMPEGRSVKIVKYYFYREDMYVVNTLRAQRNSSLPVYN